MFKRRFWVSSEFYVAMKALGFTPILFLMYVIDDAGEKVDGYDIPAKDADSLAALLKEVGAYFTTNEPVEAY